MRFSHHYTASISLFLLPCILSLPEPRANRDQSKGPHRSLPPRVLSVLENQHIWPDHTIRYCFPTPQDQQALESIFEAAWKTWEGLTNFDDNIFIKKTKIDDCDSDNLALKVQLRPGWLGHTSVGYEDMNFLDFDTDSEVGYRDFRANMLHQVGHVLGLMNEHQRPSAWSKLLFACENLADYDKVMNDIHARQASAKSDEDIASLKDNEEKLCTDLSTAQAFGFSAQNFLPFDEQLMTQLFDDPNQPFDQDSVMLYSSEYSAKKEGDGWAEVLLDPVGETEGVFKAIPVPTAPSVRDVLRARHLYALN